MFPPHHTPPPPSHLGQVTASHLGEGYINWHSWSPATSFSLRSSPSPHGLLPEPGSAGAAAAASILAAASAAGAASSVPVSAGAAVSADISVASIPATGGTACPRASEPLPTCSAGNGAAWATGATAVAALDPAASSGRRPCGPSSSRGYGPRED